MNPTPDRVTVTGSERLPQHRARSLGPVPADERFEVTVRVRRRQPLAAPAERGVHDATPPAARRYLSREDYAAQHGASPEDIAAVRRFAEAHGLVVVDASAGRRSVFLSGTAAQFSAAFGTTIEHYEHDHATYRGRSGALSVPRALGDIVVGVFGIDDRPAAQPHFQRRRGDAAGAPPVATKAANPAAAAPTATSTHRAPTGPADSDSTPHARARSAGASFTPAEIARLYDFPEGDGTGECIALIELGGGYRPADLRAYFKALGLPAPHVRTVRVDGGRNHPTQADSADGEVMLDIEVAAAVAPKAHIAVYFAPNTDKGFLDAITRALHDTKNRPSVISISWGSAEKNWTAQAMANFDETFRTAAALGVTVCCAAGDAGSGDENPDQLAEAGAQPDGLAHVDFPGSSPNVLCCGGTRLAASGGTISGETVWNDDPLRSATGGGVSDVFDPPAWQVSADVPASVNPGQRRGRGVPDVAGDADPQSGYQVRVDGQEMVIGGTSAVAPLWAGLVARMNQRLGRPVGFLNPLLYGAAARQGAFRDIRGGDNGAYRARRRRTPAPAGARRSAAGC